MTTLLYLNDTYCFTESARIEKIEHNEGKIHLCLDRTIFYPQGGGQPFDNGEFLGEKGKVIINEVRLGSDGVVVHTGVTQEGTFSEGEEIQMNVDATRRIKNARLHSAGHLIDIAVNRVGVKGLIPTKGYHFEQGPYVEYQGNNANPADTARLLEDDCQTIVEVGMKIIAEDLSVDEASLRGVSAPPGKSARYVYFDGYKDIGCGCGGTHVTTTLEIGKITVRKVSSKNGVTRISYQLND